MPLLSYRVGPYAAGGSGFFGGVIDYFNLVNMNGGINGVKMTWEECETEYNASRGVECYERLKTRNGGASPGRAAVHRHRVRHPRPRRRRQDPDDHAGLRPLRRRQRQGLPLGVPADHQLLEPGCRRWSKYLGEKAGGMDKLKGKKIVHLYHDSAYGKEPLPVLRGARQSSTASN